MPVLTFRELRDGVEGDVIALATPIGPLRRTFADVATGELLALAGSGGRLEIAVRDGSAAARLGAGLGSEVRVGPPGSPPDAPRG